MREKRETQRRKGTKRKKKRVRQKRDREPPLGIEKLKMATTRDRKHIYWVANKS